MICRHFDFVENKNSWQSNIQIKYLPFNTHLETQSVGIEGFDNFNAKYQSIGVNRNKSMSKCQCNKLMKTNNILISLKIKTVDKAIYKLNIYLL
jgi:hypothetical protein